MPILLKLKQEVNTFSKWFKILFFVLLVIYISLWFFTIYLSSVEKARKIEPLLPSAPKDSIEYVELSESLTSGHGLSIDGKIETLRVPGYPIFIAVIKTLGRSYFAITLIQILLVFASALIIRRIGILFGGKKVGEISATLLLINPVSMVLSLIILTDVLFLFLFVLGFYLAVSMDNQKFIQKTLLVSVIFVCAIYVRGMGLFALPIFITPFLASKLPFKIQLKSIAIMIIFIFISISPWILRNYVRTGVASWNSFESVNLSSVVPKFLANINGTPEEKEILAFQKATGLPDSEWKNRGSYDIRYSKQINAVGEKIILKQPFSYIKFHIITSLPFLFPSSILFMRDAYDSALNINRPFKAGAINALASGNFKSFFKDIMADWWKVTERLLWLLALLFGLFALWKERRNPLAWLFVFISGYLMLLSGPAAGPRLSFQAWPFMFILFAYGFISLIDSLKKYYK